MESPHTRLQRAEEELARIGYLARQPDGYWRAGSGAGRGFHERVVTILIRTGKAKVLLSTLRGRPMRITLTKRG